MGIDKADKMLPVVFPSRDPRMYEVLQDEIPLSDFECAVRWFECIWHGRTLERARRDVNGFREQQQQPMLHAVGAAGGRADPRRPRERRAGTWVAKNRSAAFFQLNTDNVRTRQLCMCVVVL